VEDHFHKHLLLLKGTKVKIGKRLLWLAVIAIGVAAVTIVFSSQADAAISRRAVARIVSAPRYADELTLVATSTSRHTTLEWSLDCGADVSAFGSSFPMPRKYGLRIDANHNPEYFAVLKPAVCRFWAVVSAPAPATVTLDVGWKQFTPPPAPPVEPPL
jgi:hypothetical protein